ncbi:MAG: amino acid ABC transporter permease [Proteobacteria bacterium]|nr:amino acid ABC transporter permease [Pseudomonadota bacterium]
MTANDSQNLGKAEPAGDGAGGGFDWLYSPRLRGIASQLLVVALLLWGLYEIAANTQANLKKLNQNFGFEFLNQAAGFDLSTSLLYYSSNSSFGRALIVGFWNTVLVAIVGIVLATILGFLVGVMRLSKNWVVSRTATLYIEIVRNVPLLLQIFIWYALVLKPLPGTKQAFNIADSVFISNRGIIAPHPEFGDGAWLGAVFLLAALVGTWLFRRWARKRQEATGERLPVWWISLPIIVLSPFLGLLFAGWPLTWNYPELAGFNFRGGMTMVPEFIALLLALSIYTASFIAENVRSGILAVSHGQTEASHALGLDNSKTLRLVVIPQAMRVIIPPMASQYLNLTKNSSLAVAIGYPDLMYAGGTVNNQSGKAIEVFSILLVVYLSTSLLTSLFMNWFNSRMKLVER